MGYNSGSFLKPYNTEDKNLLIFDESGTLKFTINPFSVLNVQIRGNIITVSIKSGRTVLLDFLDNNYAISALPILQDRIKELIKEKSIHIDKQVENWVENIDLISTTLSVEGNLIPIGNFTWDIGSTSSRWNNLYVKDIFAASQSLYLGSLQLTAQENEITGEPSLIIGDKTTSNFVEIAPDGLGGVLIGTDQTNLDLYNGTFFEALQAPTKGEILTLNIPPFQSWKVGDTVKIYNEEEDAYAESGYSESIGNDFVFFIGKVEFYDSRTGELQIVVEDTYDSGAGEINNWKFKLNTDNPKVTNIVQQIDGDVIPIESSSFNLGTPEKSWNNVYIGSSELTITDRNILVDGIKISVYEGASETLLETPEKGRIITLNITTGLDLSPNKSIKIENQVPNQYVDDYSDDDDYSYFSGIIESYDSDTGELTLLVEENFNVGFTSSTWQVRLNTDVTNSTSIVSDIKSDVIPESSSTFNLGTPEKSWNSLYIGNVEMNVSESSVSIDGIKISKYEGISETLLETPEKGQILTFNITTGLDLSSNKSIKVENQSPNLYVEDYSDDDTYTYFAGLIDSYDPETGDLTLLVEENFNIGYTSSTWQVRLNTDAPKINTLVDLGKGPSGQTNSLLTISGDGVLSKKMYFGTVSENQSIYVQGGDLYVNDLVFSGGSSGPQGPTGAAGIDSQMRAYYSDDTIILGQYSLLPTLVGLPEEPGHFGVQLSSYTINVGSTQTFYFYGSDFGGTNRYEFFYPLQHSGVTRNTLRMTGAINNEFRVDNISYDLGFSVWTINTTTTDGETSTSGGTLLGFGRTELSYRLNSTSGGLVITTQSVPTYSGATGQYGETRLGLSGSTPYLYVYTNQWYRFIGETF